MDAVETIIDAALAVGRFVLVVLASAARRGRKPIWERARLALAVKRASGLRFTAMPYDFDSANHGVTLVPNKSEQATLADVKAVPAC